MRTCLARAEIRAFTCDGPDAIRAYEALSPSVVLLDLRLGGGLWGSEIAVELKTREKPPAIVLMSGQSDLQRTAARIGVNGVLAKPFDVGELVSLVTCLLDADLRAV